MHPTAPSAPSARNPAAAALALLLLPLAILFSGCVTPAPVPAPQVKGAYAYTIGPGDLLEIEVWKEKDLTRNDVTVTPDGKISFPIIGVMAVQDKTLAYVADAITKKLGPNGLDAVLSPLVTVTLRQSRSAQVQVIGEVGRQGAIAYHNRLALIEALNASGGVAWASAKTEQVHIVRGSLDDPILIEVDLDNILIAAKRDIFLEPGDIVVVPPKSVTLFNRYLDQLLSPLRTVVGTASSAAGAAVLPQAFGVR